MGWPSIPLYGNADLGSAVETAKAVIAKIESNKFDKSDLVELRKALAEVDKAIDESQD